MNIPQSKNVIAFTKVKLPYGWLGNMSPFPVPFAGLWWRTSEHLFQALRFPVDSPVRDLIRSQASPMAAKLLSKKYKARRTVTPLSAEDLENMRHCLRLKAGTHCQIREHLLNTGDRMLIEDVSGRPKKNDPWGMRLQGQMWRGENLLGQMWMELRADLATQMPGVLEINGSPASASRLPRPICRPAPSAERHCALPQSGLAPHFISNLRPSVGKGERGVSWPSGLDCRRQQTRCKSNN